MNLLVTGHSRSGTGYMAELCSQLGVDVGHESIGRHGSSCWAWATDDEDPPWAQGGRSQIAPYTLIHVIRNPINVVASVLHTETPEVYPSAWAYRRKYIDVDESTPMARAVSSVVGWNRLIAAQAPAVTVAAEDAIDVMREALPAIGFPIRPTVAFQPPSKSTNARPHPNTYMGHIEEGCSPALASQLRELYDEWELVWSRRRAPASQA